MSADRNNNKTESLNCGMISGKRRTDVMVDKIRHKDDTNMIKKPKKFAVVLKLQKDMTKSRQWTV